MPSLFDTPGFIAAAPAWSARPASSDAQGPAVVFDRIGKVFGNSPDAAPALANVELQVARGEVFGIIGRSGAGKSTLLRLVNGLEKPTSGTVSVNGVSVGELDERGLVSLRRRTGMVFQHFNLLSSKTVAGNIALPLRIAGWPRERRRARVAELLELVGLSEKAAAYPAQLSGGQKQRVGIARALAAEPALLLSDEATSALDPETTLSILALLRSINHRLGLSIVLITHEMSVIRAVADQVAVLEAGRLVEQGSVADVLTQPQAESTRRLVAALQPHLPRAVRERLSPVPAAGHDPVLRVALHGDQAHYPLLSRLAAALDAEPLLLHGGIDHIADTPTGVLFVSLHGPDADLAERAVAFLEDRVSLVEIAGYVRRPA